MPQAARPRPEGAKEMLELRDADWTFGTEELSGFSPNLRELEKPPCVFVQTQDASRLGLRDKDRARILLDGHALEFDVCVVPNMAEGILILPRHRQVEWQKWGTGPVKVAVENVKKA